MFRVRNVLPRLVVALASVAALESGAAGATACPNLASLALDHGRVLRASVASAGSFLPPGMKASDRDAGTYRKLPDFCRVVVHAAPTSDSDIAIEVWLPQPDNWNLKFRGQGNGGFAGSIDYRGMADSLQHGYATAGTDTGHKGDATDASWALHHPEKVIDFGYRAVHLMSSDARTVVASFYGKPLRHAYFDSCSDGGREALMEAQRFPADYDGILAGAPAYDWTHLVTAGLALQKTLLRSRAGYIPLGKIPAINAAVLRACDRLDGVADGIISDPPTCHFQPGVLLCRGAETDACLTKPQIDTLRAIYTGPRNDEGKLFFPPVMPGSEAGDGGWKNWVVGESFGTAEGLKYPVGFFQNMVFEDRAWNFHAADVDASLRAADRKLAGVLNATNPDLGAFEGRSGKLILYHGWLDPAIPPLDTIQYFDSVAGRMGRERTDSFVRLYMVPGMQHCVGGPGPYVFGQLGLTGTRDPQHDIFRALEEWVEKGVSPGPLIASKWQDEKDHAKGIAMTRPLCPWPQRAVYNGRGDTHRAESFSCAAPEGEKTSPQAARANTLVERREISAKPEGLQ